MSETGKKQNLRKIPVLPVVTIAAFVSFMLSLFLGQGGIFRLREVRADYNRVLWENYDLAMQNRKLAREIQNLKSDPATVEKLAREQLHFVASHDTVLIVPEQDAEGFSAPDPDLQ